VKIKRGNPQVSIADCDCRMLIQQLSISYTNAQTILQQRRIDSLSNCQSDDSLPTIDECLMFIDLTKAMIRHIFEFREMYENCPKDLTDLIQTVIRVEGKKVFVHFDNPEKTAIKILQGKIKEIVDTSGFSYLEVGRENILREEFLESTS
jgi:hypothetical protein